MHLCIQRSVPVVAKVGSVCSHVDNHITPKVVARMLWCKQRFSTVSEDVEVILGNLAFNRLGVPYRADLHDSAFYSMVRFGNHVVVDLEDDR